jgi:hypothetical protein
MRQASQCLPSGWIFPLFLFIYSSDRDNGYFHTHAEIKKKGKEEKKKAMLIREPTHATHA